MRSAAPSIAVTLLLMACGHASDQECEEVLNCSTLGSVSCQSESLRFGTCWSLLKQCQKNWFDPTKYLWLPYPAFCSSDSQHRLLDGIPQF